MPVLPVGKPLSPHAFLDLVRIESCGTIFLLGWNRGLDQDLPGRLTLRANGEFWQPAGVFRLYRPDVPRLSESTASFTGFCIEYNVAPAVLMSLHLAFENGSKPLVLLDERHLNFPLYGPDYHSLRETSDVAHREHVYGYGPPCPSVLDEVLLSALSLRGSTLDFGCGMGALISQLRQHSIQADGLELDRPDIRKYLLPAVSAYVTLYDGSFPAPYPDKSYENVICSEVLEHIPNYEAALQEMVRIARSHLMITVPDIEAIPLLHKHDLVPWHLLESTHVNFFNHRSLHKLLAAYFQKVELMRIRPAEVNGTIYWNTLAAICSQPLT
jgi:2-polyprenyl-3-methyl-5-hydroxy-6-metoxy-1,4-benzoquinol methylase